MILRTLLSVSKLMHAANLTLHICPSQQADATGVNVHSWIETTLICLICLSQQADVRGDAQLDPDFTHASG